MFIKRGTVVGPTFHFNLPTLSFGTVSYGFPTKLSCVLENTSLIPMQYSLEIPNDDGEGLPWIATNERDDADSPRQRYAV